MTRTTVCVVVAVAATLTSLALLPTRAGTILDPARPAPAFTHTATSEWINSEPLRLTDLRGQVVLLDVWTFDCWNCYRSFPWLRALEARLADEAFQVIGIHSPEFEHEKIRANIEAKVTEFGLEHPIMIDNDFSYWNALANRYWPTFYVIDQQGRLRGRFIGETHAGDRQAQRIEAIIHQLLANNN